MGHAPRRPRATHGPRAAQARATPQATRRAGPCNAAGHPQGVALLYTTTANAHKAVRAIVYSRATPCGWPAALRVACRGWVAYRRCAWLACGWACRGWVLVCRGWARSRNTTRRRDGASARRQEPLHFIKICYTDRVSPEVALIGRYVMLCL